MHTSVLGGSSLLSLYLKPPAGFTGWDGPAGSEPGTGLVYADGNREVESRPPFSLGVLKIVLHWVLRGRWGGLMRY